MIRRRKPASTAFGIRERAHTIIKQNNNVAKLLYVDHCLEDKEYRMARRKINTVYNWQSKKAILKDKYKKLTDADLDYEEKRKNEMLSKLALKLGMTTREILRVIELGLRAKCG